MNVTVTSQHRLGGATRQSVRKATTCTSMVSGNPKRLRYTKFFKNIEGAPDSAAFAWSYPPSRSSGTIVETPTPNSGRMNLFIPTAPRHRTCEPITSVAYALHFTTTTHARIKINISAQRNESFNRIYSTKTHVMEETTSSRALTLLTVSSVLYLAFFQQGLPQYERRKG